MRDQTLFLNRLFAIAVIVKGDGMSSDGKMHMKERLLGKQRVAKIIKILRRTYPDAKCRLDFRSPLELLVGTILAAQCTDDRVNIVTKDLFRKYKSAADYAQADAEQLQQEIRSTGFFRNKARSIIGAAGRIVEDFAGQVPRTMDELLTLPGVARKTANVVLGNAFGLSEGIVVDTHVIRVSMRLRITDVQKPQPEKIEQDLMKVIPREHWMMFSHWVLFHGRAVCMARKPDCPHCPIARLCPSAGKG
jgi:endonuclease-3